MTQKYVSKMILFYEKKVTRSSKQNNQITYNEKNISLVSASQRATYITKQQWSRIFKTFNERKVN